MTAGLPSSKSRASKQFQISKRNWRRTMAKSTFVYVTYIRTTQERLWRALTQDAEFMKQYWFGVHCQSEWKTGSPWKMLGSDGTVLDDGEIIAADPPRKLVIRWQHRTRP